MLQRYFGQFVNQVVVLIFAGVVTTRNLIYSCSHFLGKRKISRGTVVFTQLGQYNIGQYNNYLGKLK
jgi:hypothetical protein